jgi:hypothetical protein
MLIHPKSIRGWTPVAALLALLGTGGSVVAVIPKKKRAVTICFGANGGCLSRRFLFTFRL